MIFNYVMIVTAEDEEYGNDGKWLDYYLEHPEERVLQDVVFGCDAKTLDKGENEGLFYDLYALDTGKKIGGGVVDGSFYEEIEEYEKERTNG